MCLEGKNCDFYNPEEWRRRYSCRLYPCPPLREVNFDDLEQYMIRELAREYGEGCSREHIVRLAVRELYRNMFREVVEGGGNSE